MKPVCATIIIVLCAAYVVKCQDLSSVLGNTNQNAKNMTVLQKWQSMEKSLKKATGSLVKMALPYILKASEEMNISSQCMQQGMKIVLGLKGLKPWAFRFLDSSAKIPDGLIVGSVASLGVYDECIDTEVKDEKGNNKEKVLFRGKYCTIDIKPALPPMAKFYRMGEMIPELKNLTQSGTVISEATKYAAFFYFIATKTGVCVPSGCTTEDIDQVAQKLGEYLMLDVKTYRCEIKEESHFNITHLGAMFLFCIVGFSILIGTLIDMYSYYAGVVFKSTSARFFLCFSFIHNFQKLINTDTTSDTLSCLHGLRFLSLSWIILGHTYFLLDFQAMQHSYIARIWGDTFTWQVVVNGTVAVDSFFFMGGLLVCYLATKHVKVDGKPLNIVMYVVHRLWRIYPVYIAVLLLNFFIELMSSGPLMHYSLNQFVENCYKNWWTNMLFINNFYKLDEPCLAHSWYIASDLQLYLAALLILIPILRWPRVGISLSILAIAVSIIFTGVQTYVKDLTPAMLFVQPDPRERTEFWKLMYFMPFTHVAPYCIGLLSGFLLATKPKFKLSRNVQLIGWIVAFACCFSTVYGVYNWNSGKEINFFAGMMYATFHRTVWTLGIAWMIMCCATGYGGVINYILSWKIFIPLGRLTFNAYLIHPLVQIGFMANLRHTFVPVHLFVVWIYIADLWISYAIAFAISLLVESPMIALEKLVLGRGNKKPEVEPNFDLKHSNLNGTLKAEKNEDIAVIVDKDSGEYLGMDNPTSDKL